MSEWQPIETAAKDERRDVLLWDGKAVSVGHWTPSYTEPWHGTVRGDDCPWNDFDPAPLITATHWMPLPDPPQVTAHRTE